MDMEFIYDFNTEKAYLSVNGEKKEVACFDVKWQNPDMDGTSRIWYWPSTMKKRTKAQEVLNATGKKPHLNSL